MVTLIPPIETHRDKKPVKNYFLLNTVFDKTYVKPCEISRRMNELYKLYNTWCTNISKLKTDFQVK